jgi:hypothetical protein
LIRLKKCTVTNSIIDVGIEIVSLWAMGSIGGLIGTSIPIVGSVVGFIVGIGVYFAIKTIGKSENINQFLKDGLENTIQGI